MSERFYNRKCTELLRKLNRKEKLLFLYLLSPLNTDENNVCVFSMERTRNDTELTTKDILEGLKTLQGVVFQYGGILKINVKEYCDAI